jgi:ferredoxin
MSQDKKVAKIKVDRDLCISASSCVVAADSVFELDDESKAVVKLKDDKKNSGPVAISDLADQSVTEDMLIEAAKACPTDAIFLYDESGEQIYPEQ